LKKVQEVADAVGKHPATIYRWLEAYERSERVSVFLRKGRTDRGKNRLSNKVNAIIENAIKKIYLKAEQPDVAAFASSANATVRHNDVSMHSRWRLAARSFITGRRCCHTEAIEM